MELTDVLSLVHETPVESGSVHPAERRIARCQKPALEALELWLDRTTGDGGNLPLSDPHDAADLLVLVARVATYDTAARTTRVVCRALEHPLPVIWDAALIAAGQVPASPALCDALDRFASTSEDGRARRLASVLAAESRSSLLSTSADPS